MNRRVVNGSIQASRRATTTERLYRLERQYREKEVRHISWQTWVAIAALLINVPGVWLAYSAFRDQQSINRSQQEVNEAQQAITREQQEREKRRYADRVFWWEEYKESRPSLAIHVENRSTAPIKRVQLLMHDPSTSRFPTGSIAIGSIPSCTVVIVAEEDTEEFQTNKMIFYDPISDWLRDDSGTRPNGDRSSEALDVLDGAPDRWAMLFLLDGTGTSRQIATVLPIERRSLGDCGESP